MSTSSKSRRVRLALAAAIGCAAISAPAYAGSSTGTMNVTLNVTNACVVNGAAAVQSAPGTVGTIALPDQPGIFGNVDGQLVGSLGSLQVQCSPNSAPVLLVGAGTNDAGGKRYMASNGSTVAYRLFSDAARTSEITIGQQLALGTATAQAITVPIYARVNSGGSVLAAGAYTDTVQVTLSW